MQTKKAVLIGAVLLLVLLTFGAYTGAGTATVTSPEGDIRVEVADTPEERSKGLMNRPSVPLDGMLFVFPESAERVFWMKDTRIPLDIVFIGGDGTVLNVEEADPEPGVPPRELARYRSDGPARYALEVPQGSAEDMGLSPGAKVEVHRRTDLSQILQ